MPDSRQCIRAAFGFVEVQIDINNRSVGIFKAVAVIAIIEVKPFLHPPFVNRGDDIFFVFVASIVCGGAVSTNVVKARECFKHSSRAIGIDVASIRNVQGQAFKSKRHQLRIDRSDLPDERAFLCLSISRDKASVSTGARDDKAANRNGIRRIDCLSQVNFDNIAARE